MPDEVLVTGAGGFVGRRLVAALRERGDCVHEFSLEQGDLASAQLDYPGVRRVYHLAARMFVPESWRTPRPFFDANVAGTWTVLEFCRRQNASLLMVSSYVYGKPRALPLGEEHPVQAFNPYGLTKLLAEESAAFYRDAFHVPVSIVRPFNIYGPGQADSFLIPMLIRQALDRARDAYEVADSEPRRDQLYVDDLISLLIAAADRPGGVYNAGSGESVNIADLAALINDLLGIRKPLRSRGERRPDEVMDVVADIARAERELRWRPKISLREGLAETIASMRS
jgi:nucleoside-diphosphate-sugar epimerase